MNKLGEYSSEVQFILQKSEKPSQNASNKQEAKSVVESPGSGEKSADGAILETQSENVGIVKGIPQKSSETILDKAGNSNISSENLLDLYNQRLNGSTNSNFTNTSPSPVTSIGVSGSLKPPAYRNPPAPKIQSQKIIDLNNGNFSPIFSPNDVHVHYRDLVQLIKYQREKINTQQSDLTKVTNAQMQ